MDKAGTSSKLPPDDVNPGLPWTPEEENKEDHEVMENNGLGPMRSRTSNEGQPSE